MQKECKYAIFNFEECDQNLIDEILQFLDNHAQRILDFFEVLPNKKVEINIIPTKIEMDNYIRATRGLKKDEKVPAWLIGTYKNGTITYLSLNDFKNTSHSFSNQEDALQYYKKTILHEFVHFVNDEFNIINNISYTEKFLSEGVASYLSNQREGKKLLFDYSLDEILSTKRFSACYDGWHLLMQYLIENYDKNFVLELFKNNNQAIEFLKKELFDKIKQSSPIDYKVEN